MDYSDLTLSDFAEGEDSLYRAGLDDSDIFQHFAALNESTDNGLLYVFENFTEHDYFVGMDPDFMTGLERLFEYAIQRQPNNKWTVMSALLTSLSTQAIEVDEINRGFNDLNNRQGQPEALLESFVKGQGFTRPMPNLSIMQARTYLGLLLFNYYPEVFMGINADEQSTMCNDANMIFEDIQGRGMEDDYANIFAKKMAVIGSETFLTLVSEKACKERQENALQTGHGSGPLPGPDLAA